MDKLDRNTTSPAARFERIGSSFQPAVQTGEDLKNLLTLDPAHWAITSIDTSKYICDAEFLAFLDTDRNGRIRIDEIKAAIRWVLPRIKNYKGFEERSSTLKFSDINESTEEGSAILAAARFAMHNAGMPEADGISLENVRNEKKLLSYGLSNGDGIVPPEQISDEELSAFAVLIMSLCGKVKDVSGSDGIDENIAAAFETDMKKYLAWKDAPSADGEIFFLGDDTPALYAGFTGIRDKVDEFFRACMAVRLADPSVQITPAVMDPMNVTQVETFLKTAPIAAPGKKAVLDFEADFNPLWAKPLLGFFSAYDPERRKLTMEEWEKIRAKFQHYGDWVSGKPADKFDSLDAAALEKIRRQLDGGIMTKIRELFEEDKNSCSHILCFSQVRKLILFQKYLFEFLNNYVSLKELFDTSRRSMLQPGVLVMDGRHFTLLSPITSVAEHKKLANQSYICVMYVEATTGEGSAVKKRSFAVAVTSGDMNHLFIGKSGIFIGDDSVIWDAKIVDFIQQPVSFSEALKMPFFKFGELVGKQMDKFFSARSKEIENSVDKSFKDAQTFKPGSAPVPAKPPVPGKIQTPAVSGSMMLMGGGLGLAAIGSSFAFMAQALRNVSVWNVLIVFLCIVLIFSGPLVIMSIIKLYRRSITSFMEAGGTAMNKQLRLSHKMGTIFTGAPDHPLKSMINTTDIVNTAFQVLARPKKKVWRTVLLFLILAIVFFAAGAYIWYRVDPESISCITGILPFMAEKTGIK